MKTYFRDGRVLSLTVTLWVAKDLKKNMEIKIAQSKAAVSGWKEKSRHVQEPLRKDRNCMHLLKNKNKNMEDLSLFPMFAVIVCDWHKLSLQKIKAIPELRKNNGSRF